MDEREYHEFKAQALKFVLAAYHRLAAQHAIVLIEGGEVPRRSIYATAILLIWVLQRP